jgi:hypothetical protein
MSQSFNNCASRWLIGILWIANQCVLFVKSTTDTSICMGSVYWKRTSICIMGYHAKSLVFRNCISNSRLSSSEILYASFFCNGIRETLFSLLHIGQILNESSFIVSSDAKLTKKVAHQWQHSQITNRRLCSFKGLLTVLTENKRYIFHRIWDHFLWYL